MARFSSYFGLVFLVACSSKQPSTLVVDAEPPDAAVAIVPPPDAAPTIAQIHCKSPDGKYRVDLDVYGSESRPRTARVLVDGREPDNGDSTGVVSGGGFPPPGALTCTSDEPSRCSVAHTADYGFIANVSLGKGGKRTVELRKNGLASKHLATLACD